MKNTISGRWSLVFLLLLWAISGNVTAEPKPSDEPADSLLIQDSLTVDSIPTADSAGIPDTLTEAQRMLLEFEQRYRQHEAELSKEQFEPLSFRDTLAAYFLPSFLNQRRLIDNSYALDAGDYFKFDPGFFVLSHETTPMRKTVQPFGLAGNRLNLIHNDFVYAPFEHIPEPDGLVDLYDIPTALDQNVYILPGAAGQLFGGRQSVASLVTRNRRPESYDAESALLVDKGSAHYSYARGRFAKRFTSGKRIDFSIGYRQTDGIFLSHFDRAYHYYGDASFPMGTAYTARVTGQVYDRDGRLAVRPFLTGGGSLQARDRFDRNLRVILSRSNSPHTAVTRLGFNHLRQGSYLTQVYRAQFDQRGFGGFLSREWAHGRAMVRTAITGNWLEYRYSPLNETATRFTGRVEATVALPNKKTSLAVTVAQEWVERYRLLPSAAAVFVRKGSSWQMLASLGYSERPPSLHELHLPFQEASVYGVSPVRYADRGTPDLATEKQLVGAVDLALGPEDTRLMLRVVGGRIFDGIDWNRTSGDTSLFYPLNGNVSFAAATGLLSLAVSDLMKFHGGGSLHLVDYDRFADRPFTPDYQAFSGMELHVYWKQKLIDLYGYGELVYVGPYDGYELKDIGSYAYVNLKLSFRMGRFRFHYLFQNAFSNVYERRDYFPELGRYNSWGFTWDFLN